MSAPLDRETNVKIKAYLKEGWKPRVHVHLGKYHSYMRRPFNRRGHFAVRLCGTAWLVNPRTDKHGFMHFDGDYSPEFLKPNKAESEAQS